MDLRKIFKKDTPEYAIPENLSKEDKKKVAQLIAKAKRNDGVPRTAQQSIPFERMFQDGICRVNADYYTKTIEFQDINYQLAQPEDKTTIFEEWCSFLNFFDSSVHFEISFMNMATDAESFEKSIAEIERKAKEGEYNLTASIEIEKKLREVIALEAFDKKFILYVIEKIIVKDDGTEEIFWRDLSLHE